jgi:hypothetical protein
MYLELIGRGDGLGANITFLLGQIIFAMDNNLFIIYDRNEIKEWDLNLNTKKMYESIFIQTLFDFIDIHNKRFIGDIGERFDFNTEDYYSISKSVISTKSDLISYFKNNIYEESLFLSKSVEKGYKIDFDIEKTILVHLRLFDVKDVNDYDGRHCFNKLSNKINNDEIITYEDGRGLWYQGHNKQCPIPYDKINHQIKILLDRNPNLDVIIVTSTGEEKILPYRYIQSEDYNYDLFLLSQSKYLILSKSTFAISSLFFGNQREVHLPLWGHLPIFGINTKFDLNNYFYFY